MHAVLVNIYQDSIFSDPRHRRIFGIATTYEFLLESGTPKSRQALPFTSFCEYHDKLDTATKRKIPHWFALSEDRPLAFIAGIWTSGTGTRGTKANPVERDHAGVRRSCH